MDSSPVIDELNDLMDVPEPTSEQEERMTVLIAKLGRHVELVRAERAARDRQSRRWRFWSRNKAAV